MQISASSTHFSASVLNVPQSGDNSHASVIPESAPVVDKTPNQIEPSSQKGDQSNRNSDKGVSQKTSGQVDVEAVLLQLRQRDQEVRVHEAAHLATAGGLAVGGMQFEYQVGPDGKQYAVGGEVGIEISPGKTPEETLQKARQIQQAALAPADPSPQDYAVAQQAMQMQIQAQQSLANQKDEEQTEEGDTEELGKESTQSLSGQQARQSHSLEHKPQNRLLARERNTIMGNDGEKDLIGGLLEGVQRQFQMRLALQPSI